MRPWHSLFSFWQKYEHHIGVGALVVGFAFDLWIAKRPDSTANNLLLLSYLVIAGSFIILLNIRERRRLSTKLETSKDVEPLFMLLVLQFCFGGLASNMLVLYGHSGTLAGSALFVALLVGVVFGNEYFRSRYALLRFNVGVYYFLLLTYLLVAVPIYVTHSVGVFTMILSGLISLALMAIFLAILFFAVFRGTDTQKLTEVSLIVGLIFCVFNALYFLNVIPPVPLSLKDIGIYHSVLHRSDGSYIGLYEPAPFWQFWRSTSSTYTLGPSRSAFCFSSVFAPTDLSAPIYHTWRYLDEASGNWQVVSRVSFPISGGREEGYRGFSVKSAMRPGHWRCDVETANGSLIGRSSFVAVMASTTPALSQVAL